jgi:hypothetical protein
MEFILTGIWIYMLKDAAKEYLKRRKGAEQSLGKYSENHIYKEREDE